MMEFIEKLATSGFMRIGKSCIVSLDQVRMIRVVHDGETSRCDVEWKDKDQFRTDVWISRDEAAQVQRNMDLLAAGEVRLCPSPGEAPPSPREDAGRGRVE